MEIQAQYVHTSFWEMYTYTAKEKLMSVTSFQSPFCLGLRLSRAAIPAFTTLPYSLSAAAAHGALFFSSPPSAGGLSVGWLLWQMKQDLLGGLDDKALLPRRLQPCETCGAEVLIVNLPREAMHG